MRVSDLLWVAAFGMGALGCNTSGEAQAKSLRLMKWLRPDAEHSATPSPVAEAPGPPALPPLVALDGSTRAVVAGAGGPKIYARSAITWVHDRPSSESERIGYLRAGAAVALRKASPETTEGCASGWYAVEPRGFVCAGAAATLAPDDPLVAALADERPDPARKLPYVYGTVRKPGPIYARLPSPEELENAEPGIEQRMGRWLSADGEVGASYAPFVWLGHAGEVPDPRAVWKERRTEAVPAFLLDGHSAPNLHQKPREAGQLVIGNTRPHVGYSFTRTFLWQGRRYGVTPELEILPTDRLRPIQGSDFHGVEVGHGVDFPFALVRHENSRFAVYQRATNRVIDGEVAPYREAVPLTGRQQFFRGVLHYETKDGRWISDRVASRLDPAKHLPGWATKGERWLDVNLTKQTLVLYEGTRAVYATLISSGEAGLGDSKSTTATKRGIFRIHSKHVSVTMASDEVGEEFELRDVPYVQYFDEDGHAVHGAYWHDRFGTPKSHGCINLAPEDARRIFYFTEPVVPDAWHGARDPLRGTIVFIHA